MWWLIVCLFSQSSWWLDGALGKGFDQILEMPDPVQHSLRSDPSPTKHGQSLR